MKLSFKNAFRNDFLKRTVKFPVSVVLWGILVYQRLKNIYQYPSINITSFGEYTFQQNGAFAD